MTAQPTNPLIGRQPQRAGRVTADMLHQLADSLNRSGWVHDSGLPYFVNSRVDEMKGLVHFLDRRMQQIQTAAYRTAA